MAKHFAIRASVLAAINEFFFIILLGGARYAIVNIVFLALAVNQAIQPSSRPGVGSGVARHCALSSALSISILSKLWAAAEWFR